MNRNTLGKVILGTLMIPVSLCKNRHTVQEEFTAVLEPLIVGRTAC